jgi:hypothetical protein
LDAQDQLQDQVDRQRREIHTDSYSQSISEWISLYENNEIDIHPEFQRFYRWTPLQKTKLIESILLGIPIPPIFVSQRDDGVWDVVDGLQRLSTIYQFAGILKDEDGGLVPRLVLEGTPYLPMLQGKKWEDIEDPDNSLTNALRLLIKRSKIDVSIILKESDENSKYELFQRLNTGGSPLSPQEVRNSILVMLNKELYRWMRELSNDENFREVVALTDRAIEEQYDMELVVRFLVFRKLPVEQLANIGDMGQYLTDAVMNLAKNNTLNLQEERNAFETTFRLLKDQPGSDAFHKYDLTRQKFLGGFIISAYEAVALGLGHHYPAIANRPPADLIERIKQLWLNSEFISNSGGGVRASSRIPHSIPVGRRIFHV